MQSDGYAAYRNYVSTHPGIILLACWAHAFRKFRDGLEHEPVHARGMMHLIGQLYDLEEEWDQKAVTDPVRKILRAEQSEALIPKNWAASKPGKLLKELH